MKFVIRSPALNGDDNVLRRIDRLIDRVADEVHLVELSELDALQASNWYRNARPTRRQVMLSAMARPRRVQNDRGPHAKSLEIHDAESARVADQLAHAPLVIIVEDRESDGVLLDLLVEELGWPELRVLWANGKTVTPVAVDIQTAGGKDAIPHRVERAVHDAASANRPHRLFVLCDCDARWPGDQNPSIERVRGTCDAHSVPCHVWRKRCAENYIPDEVFEAVRSDPRNKAHVERFDALLRRTPTQRDHFPVKDGLSATARDRGIGAGLYERSEEQDLRLLEERLFPKRPRPLRLLQEERREAFTTEGLRARDGAGELDELLVAIAQEL